MISDSLGPQHALTPGQHCPACAHTAAEHDLVAERYCSASTAAQIDRRCVCRTGGPR